MASPTTRSLFRGLVLTATEVKELTGWPDPMVEDYLNILNNLLTIAERLDTEIDQKIEEVPTDFTDGSVPFAESGFLVEDNANISWDNVNKLLQLNAIKLNTTPDTTATMAEGVVRWNVDEETYDFGLKDGVVGQLFEENHILIKNQTGAVITNGYAIMFAGAVGASGRLKGQYGIADGSVPSFYTMGIATQDIENGGDGRVTIFGKVRGIDTTGATFGEVWADGEILYMSPTTPGYLTKTKPNAPNLQIVMAAVVNAHATNGTLYVRPSWHVKMVDLDDVNGTALTVTGQIPVWDNGNSYFDFNYNINNYLLKTDFPSYVAGTANQVIVTDDGDNTITLSTPQDIHTGASPTFLDLNLNGSAYFLDNGKAYFGTGDDSAIYYDGTNLIIDPKLVGSGYANVKGELVVDEIITGDVVASELYMEGDFIETADSITLNTGTLASGTVADTRTINGTYYQVTEVAGTPGFDIEFVFSLDNDPGVLELVGRYQGSGAHNVVVEAYNYNTTTWDSFSGAASDIPSSTTDATFYFKYSDLSGSPSDYRSGTASKVRLYHTSAGNITHNIYVDYIEITERQFTVTTGGTFQTLTGFTGGYSNNVTTSAANGTFTITKAGQYLVNVSVAFMGSEDETFEGHVYVDGVKQDKIGTKRRLGSNGDIGSVSMTGILDLSAAEVVDLRFTSNMTGSWVAIENINFNIARIN